MRRFLVGFLAVIGVLALLVAAGIAFLLVRVHLASVPKSVVLTVDLRKGLGEGPGESGLARLFVTPKPTLRDFLDAIERGEGDPRVKGLLAILGNESLGLAQTQQVRDAITEFRSKGKFAIAFADSFGEFGAGTDAYYLAAAFDKIWLQPMGSVGLTGLYSDVMFFKGTLDLLGIEPEFARRSRFKTAINSLTQTKMTPAHREEVEAVLRSSFRQIVRGIAKDRGLSEEAVRQAIDRGPFLAREALAAKLVDHLGYRDEAMASARQRGGKETKTVSLKSYLERAGRPHRKGAQIALIYGTGLIERGSANPSLLGEEVMSSDKVAAAFRRAARDKKVRAILFRIDSPGGSAVASETIWHAVEEARRHGKPVVVSMGDLAGSGGYYIAVGADKIVAEPATLTGSIGVFAGKLVIADLLKKLGITTDSAQKGANAAMFSMDSDFSAPAHRRLEAFLDSVYGGFKERVAKGRHLTPAAVEEVAKGRVWTGEEAKKRGLVDAVGGYGTAIGLAKSLAKIPPGAPYRLVLFPPRKTLAEELYDRLTGREGGGDRINPAAFAAILPLWRQLASALTDPGALTMPDFALPR
jgi:protease IV